MGQTDPKRRRPVKLLLDENVHEPLAEALGHPTPTWLLSEYLLRAVLPRNWCTPCPSPSGTVNGPTIGFHTRWSNLRFRIGGETSGHRGAGILAASLA